MGAARIVLIGDASHGTHEFYRERALITTRLIEEKGFSMLALEADWPEGLHLDRALQNDVGSAAQALEIFSHYPTWMWGNHDLLHFVEWLQRYNGSAERPVRLFGIDVRNLWGSAQLLLAYLDSTDPTLAEEARRITPVFEQFSAGLRNAYLHRADEGINGSVATQARQLYDLVARHRDRLIARSGNEAYQHALQSATVILNGERFYGAVYEQDRDTSWNIRDTHMMDTLDRLLDLYPQTKVVLWQHNSHIGDFRATSDGPEKLNIGQLVRERHPGQSVAVGFAGWAGTVTATREWGEPPQQMTVPEADPESYEGIFHEVGPDRFLLLLTSPEGTAEPDGLDEWRGHRAIGSDQELARRLANDMERHRPSIDVEQPIGGRVVNRCSPDAQGLQVGSVQAERIGGEVLLRVLPREQLDRALPEEATDFEQLLDVVRKPLLEDSRHNGPARVFGDVEARGNAIAAGAELLASALKANLTARRYRRIRKPHPSWTRFRRPPRPWSAQRGPCARRGRSARRCGAASSRFHRR